MIAWPMRLPSMFAIVLTAVACASGGIPMSTTTVQTTLVGATPGAPITLRGRISERPWQHLMDHLPGKTTAYFDLEGGKEQTVVYWVAPPTCPGDVIVEGTVHEVRGGSKRPGGDGETKAPADYRELHVDVDSVRCAE